MRTRKAIQFRINFILNGIELYEIRFTPISAAAVKWLDQNDSRSARRGFVRHIFPHDPTIYSVLTKLNADETKPHTSRHPIDD